MVYDNYVYRNGNVTKQENVKKRKVKSIELCYNPESS